MRKGEKENMIIAKHLCRRSIRLSSSKKRRIL